MFNYSRGSEWRKWDLHVHLPNTKLSNSYEKKNGNIDWERFCEIIHSSDVAAFGMTDYFNLDSFFEFKEEYTKLYPNDEKVFFPNLELRLNERVSTDGQNIDFHIIFRPDISQNTINKFLANLKTQCTEHGRCLTCSDLQTETHFKSASISREDIKAALTTTFGLENKWIENVILVVPANNNGIRTKSKSERVLFLADEIDKFSNAIFGNPSNTQYFLRYNRFENKEEPSIPKPVFAGSDAHSFADLSNWLGKNLLGTDNEKYITWIKADVTFRGLLQTLLQPDERVYLGERPHALRLLDNNKQNYISSINVKKIESPKNKNENWFDFSLPLNNGLVSIIGNKGSGKSALSDMIALLTNCKTIEHASFLSKERFKKENKKYASDYVGRLEWADGKQDEYVSIDSMPDISSIENAQYLPQRYIEVVCNDLGDAFKDEINNVIFSYVDPTVRGDATTLEELINKKTAALNENIAQKHIELAEVNSKIIELENKFDVTYKQSIVNGLKKYTEKLERHEKNKPQKVEKPTNSEKDSKKIEGIDTKIQEIEKQINEENIKLTRINGAIDEFNNLMSRVESVQASSLKVKNEVSMLAEKYETEEIPFDISYIPTISAIKKIIEEYLKQKSIIQEKLSEENESDKAIYRDLSKLKEEKNTLISSATEQEQKYQKYLEELKTWEQQRLEIIGDKTKVESIEYYRTEKEYIENRLKNEHACQVEKRNDITREIYEIKQKIAEVYSSIYVPVELKLEKLLGDIEDNICFVSELSLSSPTVGEDLLNYVNKSFSGVFSGSDSANLKMKEFLNATDFNSFESVNMFINNVMLCVTEDYNTVSKKIKNREEFYKKLFEMNYINARYNLKVDDKALEALSPGEKGIVLLIFYLALSKDERPLIIDQPEDNLDNQSVFCKLVKCIKEAKQQRQVIIVTHNPNIAVACDSEQIIFCSMNKKTCHITYEAGSIENPSIKKHVVDVLEGTMPAFDLRKQKYVLG